MALEIPRRLSHIREVLSSRPSSRIVWPLSLIYLLATIATYWYIYRGDLSQFYGGFHLSYTVAFTILTVLISALLGILLTLIIAKIREVRIKTLGAGVTGVAIGALAVGCPGCIFGLFPLLLGFLGVGGTLAILPWNGIEFQILTVILLCVSILSLGKESDVTCKVPARKKKV